MDRDHGFAKSNLKVLVSTLVGFFIAGTVWVFVCIARAHPGPSTPSGLWTDLATIPILLSVPAAPGDRLGIALLAQEPSCGFDPARRQRPVDARQKEVARTPSTFVQIFARWRANDVRSTAYSAVGVGAPQRSSMRFFAAHFFGVAGCGKKIDCWLAGSLFL